MSSLLLVSASAAAEKPWREVRSPHFRILTDGAEGDARHVAGEFELMRELLLTQFEGLRVDPPTSLLILGTKDESTTQKLMPEIWEGNGFRPVGRYYGFHQKPYAVVQLDMLSREANPVAVVYHEYTHQLFHLNYRALPGWLNEGLASFYGFTRVEGDRTYLGAPPRNWYRDRLRTLPAKPLGEFIRYRPLALTQHEAERFSAQAWMVVHFLTLGPNMNDGARLHAFLEAMQAGTPQLKAFLDSFGEMPKLEKAFREYSRQISYPAWVVATPPHPDEKSFAARPLSIAETQAELGSFYLITKHWKEARIATNAALSADPNNALAHENLGLLAIHDGKDDDAMRELARAYAADNRLFRSLFVSAMLAPSSRAASATDRGSFRETMNKVLESNGQFAPAYAEIAKSFLLEGKLDDALLAARMAADIDPDRAGYHLLVARIQLRAGHPSEAATGAAYVAKVWGGPDRDEALEVLNSIPAEQRPATAGNDATPDAAVSVVEGRIVDAACDGDASLITLERDGKLQKLTIGKVGFGCADTLWFCGDLFDHCHHLVGLRAVIESRTTTDPAKSVSVVNWGIRDDFEQADRSTAPASASGTP